MATRPRSTPTPLAAAPIVPAPVTKPHSLLQTLLDRPSASITLVFLIALGIRLIYLIEMRDSALCSVLLGDSAGYDRWAKQITSGQWIGNEVFYQAPFYPYFLAVVYTFFGPSTWAVRIIQAVIGAVAAAWLTQAGRKWFGALPGLLAGLMLAAYPPAIFFDGLLQKSVWDSLWMAALLALMPAFDARRSLPVAALLGAILGLFALTRENALVLVPIIAVWIVLRPVPNRRRRAAGIAALFAGLLIILVPVGVRNAVIGGRFLLTTAQFGPNFYIGNNPQADGFYRALRKWRAEVKFEQRDARELAEAAAGRSLSPGEVSRFWSRRSWNFIRTQPLKWMKLTGRKWMMTWNVAELSDTEALEAYRDESWLLLLIGPFLHFGIIAPLAAIGMAFTIRRWRALGVLYAMILALALTVALFFVFARYRFPIAHPLLLFAGTGVVAAAQALRSRAYPTIMLAAVPGLLFAMLVNIPRFEPRDPRALTFTNVAGALVDRGLFPEAHLYFDKAFAVDPDLPELHYAYAEALGKQHKPAEAADYLRKVIAAHPDLADARLLLAQMLVDAGQPEEAMARCAEALKLAPTDLAARESCAQVLGSAGNAYARRGAFTEAARCYREVIQLDPKRASALNNLGLVLAQLGQTDEAERWFNSAIDAAPNLADAHNNLGQLWKARGDIEKARASFLRALEIDPAHALARQNLELLSN